MNCMQHIKQFEKRRALLLFIAVCSITVSCSNLFKYDLEGKTLYLLSSDTQVGRVIGLSIPVTYVHEFAFNFKTDKEVEIVRTAYYGWKMLIVNKTSVPQTYNYTYNDGHLNVLSDIGTIKLTDAGDYFTTDDGEVFYKSSILSLSRNAKRDRLNKVLNYPKDIEKRVDEEIAFEIDRSPR